MISEDQLTTWSTQGPTQQFTETYNRIRANLIDAGAPYLIANIDVFLQGSYSNTSNVRGDSDVDIVLCHTGAFFHDLSNLSPQDLADYNRDRCGAVGYGYWEFKRDAVAYIAHLYDGVDTSRKALFIPGGTSGRRDADVLVCQEYRRYYEYRSVNSQRFALGLGFYTPGGVLIDNYPKLHSKNCTAKHQDTNGWFKPVVRIFKNMRNRLIEAGGLVDGEAPSYFIESMLYNVPNPQFSGTYQQTWINCYNWLAATDQTKLTTASGMHWLVRDNSPTSWSVEDFKTFLRSLKTYWEA